MMRLYALLGVLIILISRRIQDDISKLIEIYGSIYCSQSVSNRRKEIIYHLVCIVQDIGRIKRTLVIPGLNRTDLAAQRISLTVANENLAFAGTAV